MRTTRGWLFPWQEQPEAQASGCSRGRAREEAQRKKEEDTPDNQDDKPYCALHNSHTHDTTDCREVKKLGEERQKEWREKKRDGEKHKGGRGGGRTGKRGGRGGKRDRPPRGRDNQDDDNADNNLDSDKEESEGGFQEAKGVACIHGGAQTPHSNRHFKQLTREVNAALPGIGARARPLKWVEVLITFDAADHPTSMKGVGLVPLVVSPTISQHQGHQNACRRRGGTQRSLPRDLREDADPFRASDADEAVHGCDPGKHHAPGQVSLPVTFGTPKNYRTENIIFDVAHIGLPYNAILGYPALAKFMAVTHHAYNTVKMPGPQGAITIQADQKDSVRCIERIYKAAASAAPDDQDGPSTSSAPPPRRQKLVT